MNKYDTNPTFEQHGLTVFVNSDVHFSKRFLKYLVKKYLHSKNLRGWIRVVASEKDQYQLRYLRIGSHDEDDDEQDSE